MNDELRESYEKIAYPAEPQPRTHPARLAAIASLLGIKPPAVETSHVLEIGCADGSNLLPLASAFPQATFVGIDLSENAIAQGTLAINQLGLRNVELIAGDFTKTTEWAGTFDTIIAHGVYSWIPQETADSLLSMIGRALSPQGIAYVSYNTWPGWQPRSMLRELILRRYRESQLAREELVEIRELLTRIQEAASESPGHFPALLVESLEAMLPHPDAYIRHDMLECCQRPTSFLDFARQLEQHELQYVGDAEFHTMFGRGILPGVLQKLTAMAKDLLELEHLMDLMVNRSFRQSVICRTGFSFDRRVTVERVLPLWATGLFAEIETGAPWTLTTTRGLRMVEGDPLHQEIVRELMEAFPAAIQISDLAERLGARQGKADEVGRYLLNLATYDAVDLQTASAGIAAGAEETIEAWPMAVWMARRSERVTNLRHELVQLTEQDRQFLWADSEARGVFSPETRRSAIEKGVFRRAL